MWHCESIRDGIQHFASLQQPPTDKGEAVLSRADIAKFKEYQVVEHIQSVFTEAIDNQQAMS